MAPFRFLSTAAFWLQDQFDWMLRNIVFPAQIVFIIMASWGLVGAELGVERLFWSEDWLFQLSAGMAVGMLFGILLFVWFLLDQPTRFVNLVAPIPAEGKPPRYWSLLPSETSPVVRRLGAYLLWALLLLLIVILVGKVLVVAIRATTPEARPVNLSTYFAGRLYLIPGVVGYLLSLVLAWFLYKIDETFNIRERIARSEAFRKQAGFTSGRVSLEEAPLHAVMIYMVGISLLFIIAAAASVVVMNTYYPGKAVMSPVVLVCLLFILFNQIYGYWSRHVNLGTVLLVVAAGLLIVWNSPSLFPEANFKLRFPGLENEYPPEKRVALTELITDDDKEAMQDPDAIGWVKGRPRELPAPHKRLLKHEEILAAMSARWQKGGSNRAERRPKLILVSVSGGGIRSAVWTTRVLEGLEELMPGTNGKAAFRDHVRMFTGASGGMVGAALYVADFDHDRPDRGDPQVLKVDGDLGLGLLSGTVAEQSLLPTFQTAALRDFSRNLFVPPWSTVSYDRGRALEDKWMLNARERGFGSGKHPAVAAELAQLRQEGKRLSPFNRTFADLYAQEKEGLRPSLIFSPMLVEDSRRLLISNLDLGSLAVARGPLVRSPQKGGVQLAGEYSRSGIELMKLFPSAHASFQVGTAARMSATFPVISPAVCLPTIPPRRVVDAGYFDNYGVDLAAMWLIQNRDLLREYTGGVALIEVRAFPLQDRGSGFQSGDPDQGEAGGVLGDSVAALSTPLRAVLRARANGTYHRNNELLSTLDAAYNTDAPPDSPPFRRFVFELDTDAALNWYLSTEEKKGIAKMWKEDEGIKVQANELAKWLGDGGGSRW
ncbi:MAG TPA: hypothetical protein VLM40_23390 [Gemmata sp.]|nr:hypothetical protein [Gemmata sp.]